MATRTAAIRLGGFRETVRELGAVFAEHGLLTFASAIAFRALVAIVPLVLLGLALLGFFGLTDVWTDTVAPALKAHLRLPVFEGIDSTVRTIFASESAGLIALSTALVVWDMTWAVNAVMEALNRIHEVEERRSTTRRIAVAAALGVAVVVCLIASVLVQALAPSLADGALDVFLGIVRWPVAIFFLWIPLGLLFRYAPAEKPAVRWASGGSLVVIGTWIVASVLFRFWITDVANFKSATGSLTVFLVLTTYVFISAAIFLVGVELDELARKRNARS